MSRKRRKGEVICRCHAYAFPHRLSGGRCDGSGWVDHQLQYGDSGLCQTCVEFKGWTCAVAEGRESLSVCGIFHEAVREAS